MSVREVTRPRSYQKRRSEIKATKVKVKGQGQTSLSNCLAGGSTCGCFHVVSLCFIPEFLVVLVLQGFRANRVFPGDQVFPAPPWVPVVQLVRGLGLSCSCVYLKQMNTKRIAVDIDHGSKVRGVRSGSTAKKRV